MSTGIKKKISRNILNILGWHSKRKIVVIESDDWGTIRMASKDSWKHFVKKGYAVDRCPYNTNDALECNDDMELLFDALQSVKDKNGNSAVLTANNIVANPDFDKIKASGYTRYFYESFTETLKRYPAHNRVENLYREGIQKNIFRPQFHGREHVNVQRWMNALQQENPLAQEVFEHSMFSIHEVDKPAELYEYLNAFDADSVAQIESQEKIINEGLFLFEQLWGFRSKSFIAPCYIWSRRLETFAAKHGIKYFQGIANQMAPLPSPGFAYKKIYHYPGQKNKHAQRYIVRNVFFEPSLDKNFDWHDDSLHRIQTAFKWGKPAVISAHRLNFMGWLQPANRDVNLKLLKKLLQVIIKKWPDTEFMATDQLGSLMEDK